MADPLPTQLADFDWQTIGAGHHLVYLGEDVVSTDVVIDWAASSGGGSHARFWNVDASSSGDPLPTLLSETDWQSIDDSHVLVYAGGDQLFGHAVLDWEPASGHVRSWKVDLSANDILPTLIGETTWATIQTGHELVYIGYDRMIDWERATGHARLWTVDRTATGDPLPTLAAEVTWQSIQSGHELIYVGGDTVFDWEPASGHVRVWQVDRFAAGDFLPTLLADHTWQTIRTGHELVYLGGTNMLDWEPQPPSTLSHGRVWQIARLGATTWPVPTMPLDDWRFLMNFRPPVDVQQRIKASNGADFNRIEDAVAFSPVNLDYYPVQVDVLPQLGGQAMTPEAFLEFIRLHIDDFVDTSVASFSAGPGDTLWDSASPLAAQVHIDIPLFANSPIDENASVGVGEAASDHWIFCTLRTNQDHDHPVSGNRWFGFTPSVAGAWVFATRGADRPTGWIDLAGSARVFSGADTLWVSFQQKLADYVNNHGGQATILPKVFSQFDWLSVRSEYYDQVPKGPWV